jgi:hypothetical protein
MNVSATMEGKPDNPVNEVVAEFLALLLIYDIRFQVTRTLADLLFEASWHSGYWSFYSGVYLCCQVSRGRQGIPILEVTYGPAYSSTRQATNFIRLWLCMSVLICCSLMNV